jgi:starvation-inducible DNA-binding protein
MDRRIAANTRSLALATPTDLGPHAAKDIAIELTASLADVFALYLMTKNFHWHMSVRIFATTTGYSTSRVHRYLR